MNYYRYLIKDKDFYIDFVVPNEISRDYRKELEENNSNVYKIDMSIRRKLPFKYIMQLKKIIKQGNYDIVHVHGSSAIMYYEMLAAQLAGCKVRIAHSHNTVTEHRIIHKLLYPFFERSFTDAFSCGEAAGKWLFKNKKFYVLPNAQNFEKFKFNKEIRKIYRTKYNLEDRIVIGHVGAFNFQKNHEFILDVFKEIYSQNDKYYLVLIGEGELMGKMKEKAKKLGINDSILFVGRTTKVNEWLNAMDIMVLPSNFEGFPNVLIEWQIAGLPCIVSNKVTEAVKLTDLVQFETLNVEKWTERILTCGKRKKQNDKNLKILQEKGFDIKKNVDKLKIKYKEICDRGEKNETIS